MSTRQKMYCLALTALFLLLTGFMIVSAANAGDGDIRVMSFNIRNGTANDGENH